MERYLNAEDEKAAELLARYRAHEQSNWEEAALLRLLRSKGKLLLPYTSHNLKRLVSHLCEPIKVSKLLEYSIAPLKKNSKHKNVVNVTDMAKCEGYSTQHLSGLLKEQGYIVKYDRNRVYDLDRVITYIEVK